jgi:hypothetical protein
MERNEGITPLVNQLDISICHDIKVFWKNGRFHTVRFSFDIANFLNLLNKNWGVQQTTVFGGADSPQYQFLCIKESPNKNNNYTLTYTMRKDLTETFLDYTEKVSRWQMQFGVKYIF